MQLYTIALKKAQTHNHTQKKAYIFVFIYLHIQKNKERSTDRQTPLQTVETEGRKNTFPNLILQKEHKEMFILN